jgi:hypothetical protein
MEPAEGVEGYVWQAEEVYRNGHWQRFFGFAGDGLARVRAEEVVFQARQWGRLPNRLGARLVLPGATEVVYPLFFPGQQVVASLRIRNQAGASREVPGEWYRDAAAGGPVLPEGYQFRVHCWTVPLPVRNQDHLMLQWFASRFSYRKPIRLVPRANTGFAPGPETVTLEAGESIEVARIDLADWFDVNRPGIYTVALIIPGDEGESRLGYTAELRFAIGTRRD